MWTQIHIPSGSSLALVTLTLPPLSNEYHIINLDKHHRAYYTIITVLKEVCASSCCPTYRKSLACVRTGYMCWACSSIKYQHGTHWLVCNAVCRNASMVKNGFLPRVQWCCLNLDEMNAVDLFFYLPVCSFWSETGANWPRKCI